MGLRVVSGYNISLVFFLALSETLGYYYQGYNYAIFGGWLSPLFGACVGVGWACLPACLAYHVLVVLSFPAAAASSASNLDLG